MSSITEDLLQHLSGSALTQVENQLGTDRATASKAVGVAIPVILAALAKNASNSGGASSLSDALGRDHDGSILNDVPAALTHFQTGAGAGILKHVLGDTHPTVAAGVGQASGLDTGKATALLTMLAPLVMGALGRAQRSGNLDAGGLAAMLGQERAQVETNAPALGGLMGMLDRNKDGSVVDDIAGYAGKIFGR
jgi:hypothetical protein